MLKNIDEVRRRANVSYEKPKTALKVWNDDLVEAEADNPNNL